MMVVPGLRCTDLVTPKNSQTTRWPAGIHLHTMRLYTVCPLFTGPISFSLGNGEVIRGWDYAVSTMQKGERIILTVGPHYGYGLSGSGPIPPSATLTFEMELMGWEKPAFMEWYQWIGLVVVVGIIVYALCFDDEADILRKARSSPQEL